MNRFAMSLLLSSLLMLAQSAMAADVENFVLEEGESLPRSAESEAVHQEIESVLASDDFARKKTVTRWQAKKRETKEQRQESFPGWMIAFMEYLEATAGFFKGFALAIKVLIFLLFAWLIYYVVKNYRRQIGDFFQGFSRSEAREELPTTLFGLDVQKTSLPKDVIATAEAYWGEGDQRRSLATLLRASLIKLLHEHECRFYDSDTELECCARIEQQANSDLSQYMWQLVTVWQQLAYAHQPPTEVQFTALCQTWREVF